MPPSAAVPEFIHESVRALPVLPTAVTRLLALAREVDVDFREIARVIETDQTLTARTLRAANSPLNSLSRRVTTVKQATVLLGADTIVNLALGVSVMSLQSSLYKHLPIDPAAFGRHSVAVALAARRLARHFKLPNPGEAFVAGLLHDIGKLVLLMHYGETYARLMRQAHDGAAPLHLLEAETFDLDHALVGHALCLHWHLPPAMAQAVAEHHAEPAPRSVAAVVSRANDLVKTLGLGHSGNRYVAPAPASPPRDPINREVLRETVLGLPHETQQAEEALGRDAVPAVHTASTRPLVQLQIKRLDDQELLAALLWSMGYEPVSLRVAASNGQLHPAAPAALLTDTLPSDLHQLAYQQHNLPVLHLGAWRAAQGRAADAPFDAYSLRAWLEENLP